MKHRKQSRFTKILKTRHIPIVVFILLFAVLGSYLVFQGTAVDCFSETTNAFDYPECTEFRGNPALTNSCVEGLDIALLMDTSYSMVGSPSYKARDAIRTFIRELNGTNTYFASGLIHQPEKITSFTNNQTQALANVQAGTIRDGSSYLGNLRSVTDRDPRPNIPNLIIILTDGVIKYHIAGVRAVQQAGTRILAIAYGERREETLKFIAGPNVDTGSIWTSDVITFTGNLDKGELDTTFKMIADQCKNTKPAPLPGHGHGNGGTGTGTNGQGQGEGPSSGAGGGGGGSSANKQQEKPNPVPKAASQGETVEPPKPEPSPFFDGKEFKPGSDKDTLAGTIGKAGKKVANTWPIALAVIILGGITGFGYWKWRQSRNA